MTILLQPVTPKNWYACTKLKVRDDQTSFVAPNVFSMAQSKFFPETEIRAIYAGEALVGFVMWGDDDDHDLPEMWVWRLMIDGAHQGKGYGRAAMTAVLDLLRAGGSTEVFLSYAPDNTSAARFYERLGFESTGRVEHGEIVVRLDLTAGH